MARPARPVPAIVLRTQSLSAAVDAWSKCQESSPEAAEYMEMACYWYRSLDPFLNRPSAPGAEVPAAAAASNPKGGK